MSRLKALVLCTGNHARGTPQQVRRFAPLIAAAGKAGIDSNLRCVKTVEDLFATLRADKPHLVFSTIYHVLDHAGFQRNIHALLDEISIPYIGSHEKALELVLSKTALKRVWLKKGVETPNFLEIGPGEVGGKDLAKKLSGLRRYPYILKPILLGNSRGITKRSIVRDLRTLQAMIPGYVALYGQVFLEEFLGNEPGLREFTVAMVGEGRRMLLMPAEIVFKKPSFPRLVTTRDKDGHRTRAMPVGDQDLRKELLPFAHKVFLSGRVRDYARCDILQVRDTFYAIEINGQPMVPDLWFENCAKDAGLDENQYIQAIFLAGIARNIQKGMKHIFIPTALKNALPPAIVKILCRDL
jgi:D-alanine-D-alanine ligase-like ATP-grasp enzyme